MKSVSLWEMRRIETIEEFYTRKFGGIPENIRHEIGHFNVFKLDPFVGDNAKPVPYARRDFYKIMLVKGNYKMHYADGVTEIQKQALVFSNPQIPYSCEYTTSQIIAQRVIQESKILLKHSPWNVSEIAYSLGFTETTHFNNFFKKHLQLSPLKFRNL